MGSNRKSKLPTQIKDRYADLEGPELVDSSQNNNYDTSGMSDERSFVLLNP